MKDDGSGYGDGYGYGYGDGSGSEKTVYLEAILQTAERSECYVLSFWRSDSEGRPSNGGGGQARRVGLVETVEGPLKICTARGLHGTMNPAAWKGERWWIVALYKPIQVEGHKMASLKREILVDLGKCPF